MSPVTEIKAIWSAGTRRLRRRNRFMEMVVAGLAISSIAFLASQFLPLEEMTRHPSDVVVPITTISATEPLALRMSVCGDEEHTHCIVDGDTLWVAGVKIRLADVDTPEIFSPQCVPELALGRQARDRLRTLINSGPITFWPADRDEDMYGRKLRILKLNGLSVGDILVSEGLARPWDGARHSWCTQAALTPSG